MVHSSISPFLDQFQFKYSNKEAISDVIPRIENIPFLIKNEPFRFYILLNKHFSSTELDFSYYDNYAKKDKKMKLFLDKN